MNIYPKLCLKKVTEVDVNLLQEQNIKGVILDVDNTLIDYNRNLIEGAVEWCNSLKKQNIKFCIVSNSNQKSRVETVANTLEIPYILFAKKPLLGGIKKAVKILGLDAAEIALVGDQLFTDVIGANRMKIYSILIEPIGQKEGFITRIKRPFEKAILRTYRKDKHG